MEITIHNNETESIIEIDGRIDTVNAPEFEKRITPIIQSSIKDVILDCKKLVYISSLGLRHFLTLLKTLLARNGKLKIVNMNEDVKKIFDMTGFSQLFEFN